ncbi:MAG: hypothetical protein ACRDWE_11455 [Acidimicrobiales bacterium]
MVEGRVLPPDISPRARCLLIGAGIRGRMANIAELATLAGQGKASPFADPSEAWDLADRELDALARLLDVAGPECEVPERVLSATPAPAPPDAKVVGLADAVRRRSRSDVRALLLQFDAFYELLSEEAANPDVAAGSL